MAIPASPDDRKLARLMALAQAGDSGAYARVLRGCVGIIGGLRAKDGSPIDPIATETCLRTIHASRHTFDPRRSFVLWVTAIARHHGLSPRTDARSGDGDHDTITTSAGFGCLEVSA